MLEQQDAEAVEAGVLQGEAVLGLIHAEAAGSAGTGGKEDVIIDDVLTRHPLRLELLQVLHQIADGEVGRIALAVIPVFLTQLKSGDIGAGHNFAFIPAALKDGAYQGFMFPGKAAEQDSDMVTLFGPKSILFRLFEMV